MTAIFEARESAVRSYCRSWPVVFDRAAGTWLYDTDGRGYLDFFAGAGALNYGHNDPVLKKALLDYLGADRVVHSLDMYTSAKERFLTAFDQLILGPRELDYLVQFPGPGGTNAVEAALKLARKVTGRQDVLCFTNGFHGMTLGALAVTGNGLARGGAGTDLGHAIRLPFDHALDGQVADFSWLDRLLDDPGSGVASPAAAIVETVQGEGGVRIASDEWLRALEQRCRRHGMLLIVDDVQMGCGRTGPFFSFERAGIHPDIVCLSKSISGYGLPMALTLLRPELDVWEPGEHNGTFRGFDPAMVTGAEAFRLYWSDDRLAKRTEANGIELLHRLKEAAVEHGGFAVRGKGLVLGLVFDDPARAKRVSHAAFDHGLLVETAGPRDEVVKLLPPLTATDDELEHGLDILELALRSVG